VTAPTTIRATDAYVDAVATALDRSGVSDPERQELLDDLTGHLAELEAEDDDALTAQLGPPADYAAELLTSAGIVVELAAEAEPEPLWRQARAAGRRMVANPRFAAARTFLPELRPGWWVLRAWAILVLITAGTSDHRDMYPLPEPVANPFLSLVLLVGGAVASVRLGRRRGWLDRLVTVVGVIGVLVALANGSPRTEYVFDGDHGPFTGLLVTPEGTVVENIWPYDADGNPLDGVLLFDQYGQPITLGQGGTAPYAFPGLFPQEQTTWELDPQTGEEREVPVTRPPIDVPRLPGATTTSPTSTTTTVTTTTTAPPPAG
jgi:hypothetical protein